MGYKKTPITINAKRTNNPNRTGIKKCKCVQVCFQVDCFKLKPASSFFLIPWWRLNRLNQVMLHQRQIPIKISPKMTTGTYQNQKVGRFLARNNIKNLLSIYKWGEKMTKVSVIEVENYGGFKIKLNGSTAQQIPSLELAQIRAENLAASEGEETYEIYYLNGEVETIEF